MPITCQNMYIESYKAKNNKYKAILNRKQELYFF